MHEWALAEGVISTALEVAEREGLNEITAIKIKMGELQQIDLEIFELALTEIRQSQMPMVANARTELEREAAVLKCRVCGREWAFADAILDEEERESIHFLPEIAYTYIACPQCKSPDFQFVKGRGVWIDSIVGRLDMDPRLAIIGERFKDIKRLIAIAGGKGGIGKSMIASTLALILSDMGYRVGLLDLDFCGPSTHAILGIDGIYPEEDKGIVPPQVHGIKFLSIVYYAGDNPSPLRGSDISNAMIELLAITRWGSLDFLIIDMPPGIGDTALDTVRLIKRVEFLVITTPSRVALETVGKTLRVLKDMSVPIIGVVENMKMAESSYVREQMRKIDVPFGGEIAFDRALEDSVGDAVSLLGTDFAQNLRQIVLSMPAFEPQDGG